LALGTWLASRSVASFIHALAAVLAGNAAYFLLMPFLPSSIRHVPFRIDLGLAVDSCFCVVAFGILKAMAGRKRAPRIGEE
jgi:hypothetical protein